MIFDSLGSLPLGTIPISIIIDIGIDPITHHHYVDNIVLTSITGISVSDITSKHKLDNVVLFIFGELGTFDIVVNTIIVNEETLFIVKRLEEILSIFIKRESVRAVPNQEIVLYARKSIYADLATTDYLTSSITILNKEIMSVKVKKEEVN